MIALVASINFSKSNNRELNNSTCTYVKIHVGLSNLDTYAGGCVILPLRSNWPRGDFMLFMSEVFLFSINSDEHGLPAHCTNTKERIQIKNERRHCIKGGGV